MSRCLVVQHVAPEGAFAIEEVLRASGVGVDVCRVYAGDAVPPDTAGLDGLVVMGGPMSAGSNEGFPSREAELALLADALRGAVPTLGVCLGAQLVAVAGGGAAYPGARGPEIGWGPVTLGAECRDDTLFRGLPERLTVLHWHGDTFDLPQGARHLIANERYANQAFRLGDVAWGVQFHLEVTRQAVEDFVTAFASDLEGAATSPAAIRSAAAGALAALAPARDLVCGRFASLVADRVGREDLIELA
jgi:GMP synthase-like glutamine amidotransferase